MKGYLKIVSITLITLLFSLILAYRDWQNDDVKFGCGIVYDIPYDYKINDVPGENYVVINMEAPLPYYRWVLRAKEEFNLKPAKMPIYKRNEKILVLGSLLPRRIKPLLASEGMRIGDDILIMPEVDFDPPLLLVGVYNPTPRKICVLKRVLDSFRSERYYNYKYIFYHMLTPLSMEDEIQELQRSIPWNVLEARARSIFGISDEEAWEIGVHYLNKSYIVLGAESIVGGLEIDVLVPNPPMDKVHEWVVEVRKYVPEDMPVIFAFTEKRHIVGEPDVAVTPIKNKNTHEMPVEEVANEECCERNDQFYILVVAITGLIIASTFIINRYIMKK